MATVTSEYTAIDSLTISLIGNASAKLKINFEADIVTISSFKNILNSQSSWESFLVSIIEFLTKFLLTYLSGSAIPKVGSSQNFNLPSNLLTAIFNLQTSKVTINGDIDMTNNSSIPITAKVFAEALTVDNNGKKQQIINPEKMFLGYENNQLKGVSAREPIKIIPITGATITSS
ncbi:conserved protein of unknown function [Tenacibaculum sp. 190130A14a]|uniref:Uncharacterized protein n=1 Tax=Tenacibaculum polynesiense TaxID=3137857 RepID=A0ABM9PD44_9FLAO